ncbi:MAG TPA: peptidoglycan DD-metalloendopeptidase family protein [Pyrinomonadaceae bacterium]
MLFFAAAYGVYGLTQHMRQQRVEQENARLRAENEKQRQFLSNLNNRIERVEDASRKLAEMSGVSEKQPAATNGAGARPPSVEDPKVVENKSNQLELELRVYKIALRERTAVPSVWPVAGTLERGFGVRRNRFGDPSYGAHAGRDIQAASGASIVASGSGTVTLAKAQDHYGYVVYIDHGNGFSTRYAHLSSIDVTAGQQVLRGERLGLVGSTGRSDTTHVHFEVRIHDKPVDPRLFLTGARGQG